MSIFAFGRLVSLLAVALSMTYIGYRICLMRYDPGPSRSIIIMLFALFVFQILPGINAYQEALGLPVPKWRNVLGYPMFSFAVLLGYFAMKQFLNNQAIPIRDILRHRLFLITAALIGLQAAILQSRPSSTSFSDGVSFERSWSYAAAYFLCLCIFAGVGWLIVRLLLQDLQRYKANLPYRARRIAGLLGAGVVVIAALLGEINLALSFLLDDPKIRFTLNWIVQDAGRALACLLLLIGFAIPQSIFIKAVRPLERYLERQHYKKLYYLCQKIGPLLPQLSVPQHDQNILRVLIILARMREFLATNSPHTAVLPPRAEADYLFELINNGARFDKLGPYKPALSPKDYYEFLQHNLRVAKHLKQLEVRQHSMSA
jgi:hypothetical protein